MIEILLSFTIAVRTAILAIAHKPIAMITVTHGTAADVAHQRQAVRFTQSITIGATSSRSTDKPVLPVAVALRPIDNIRAYVRNAPRSIAVRAPRMMLADEPVSAVAEALRPVYYNSAVLGFSNPLAVRALPSIVPDSKPVAPAAGALGTIVDETGRND